MIINHLTVDLQICMDLTKTSYWNFSFWLHLRNHGASSPLKIVSLVCKQLVLLKSKLQNLYGLYHSRKFEDTLRNPTLLRTLCGWMTKFTDFEDNSLRQTLPFRDHFKASNVLNCLLCVSCQLKLSLPLHVVSVCIISDWIGADSPQTVWKCLVVHCRIQFGNGYRQ